MSEATQVMEESLAAEKELVELRDSAQRLHANPDFRRLIEKEYMLYEPARLAMAAGDPILEANVRADMLQMALAAGHLKRFLSVTIQRGNMSANNVAAINENLDEMRAEEAQD